MYSLCRRERRKDSTSLRSTKEEGTSSRSNRIEVEEEENQVNTAKNGPVRKDEEKRHSVKQSLCRPKGRKESSTRRHGSRKGKGSASIRGARPKKGESSSHHFHQGGRSENGSMGGREESRVERKDRLSFEKGGFRGVQERRKDR